MVRKRSASPSSPSRRSKVSPDPPSQLFGEAAKVLCAAAVMGVAQVLVPEEWPCRQTLLVCVGISLTAGDGNACK